MMRFDAETIGALARLLGTVLAAFLSVFAIDADADTITTAICCAATLVLFGWTWWKNNNITSAAKTAQSYLDELKEIAEVD